MDLLLYALNEAGEPAYAERLPPEERQLVRERALRHLEHYHAVEVWEGPTCILRLRRAGGK